MTGSDDEPDQGSAPAPAAGPSRRGHAPRHVDPRRDYLDEVVAQLWPGDRVSSARSAVGTSFALVPNGERPAAMVPRRPRRAAAAVLRNYKASADRRTQLRLQAYSLGARVGLADLLPHRVTIAPPGGATGAVVAGDIVTYLSDALGEPVVVALYTSPPRANRKPVLQLLTASGNTFGFAKIGTTELSRDLVAAEGRALARLSTAAFTRIEVPRLLHHGRWNGFEILVQQALPRSGQSAMRPADLGAAMVELAAVDGLREHPATSNPYLARLRHRLGQLSHARSGPALAAAFERTLDTVPAGETLRFGAWHGDWTPWNMSTAGNVARVWDWERFETGVPLGFDAVHHDLQGAIVRSQQEPRAAIRETLGRASRTLAPFDITPVMAHVTALLYLLEIGVRYEHDGQEEAGSKRGRLETWLLPELTAGIEAGERSRNDPYSTTKPPSVR